MLSRCALALIFLLSGGSMAMASTTESIGTDVAVALPLIAGAITVYKGDFTGTEQLGLVGLTTVGTVYGLKHLVREPRPDRSDAQSFPSDTAALAFAPAQFLWDRYGWQYGLPAYAAAGFVGWSRVDAKKHHWYDVAASAGISFGFSKLITTRYRARGLYYGAEASPDGGYIHLSYNF